MTRECKTVCEVRGITLNYNASQLVNFDRIKDMILRRDETETLTADTEKSKRKRGNGRINITEPEDKVTRVSFLKRRRLNDNTSVPFGNI
jgi:PBP1b-binding outer membrane lipoprotein LpoB